MTITEIVALFKKHKPNTAKAATKLGLKLQALGSGLYRRVYVIRGYDLVVKFNAGEDDGEHAAQEVKTVWRVLRYKKYASIRKYMPKIYYFDKKTGTTLVKKYETFREDFVESGLNAKFDVIEDKVMQLFPDGCCDLHGGNFGAEYTKTGRQVIKIIDLGLCE
jgi:ribosomal 50S subunit-associated protein YjgA (DUF615 family)